MSESTGFVVHELRTLQVKPDLPCLIGVGLQMPTNSSSMWYVAPYAYFVSRYVQAPCMGTRQTVQAGEVYDNEKEKNVVDFAESVDDDDPDRLPTEGERATLRLVSAPVPWAAYAIAIVEFGEWLGVEPKLSPPPDQSTSLAERASYYGCSGVFTNFIQRPLPAGGNGAGATLVGTQLTPGALGLGLEAATGIVTTFSFLAYIFPIVGGILADTKWGRYKTIVIGTAIGAVAHIVLLIAAIPSVIHGGHAVIPFVISILILALGTGMIKASFVSFYPLPNSPLILYTSVAPLMADQARIVTQRITTLKTGERVILDPGVTTQNVMLIYYWCINIGAFMKVATTYAEKRVGFWLAYLIPLIIYLLMPAVLLVTRNSLIKLPPQGSVVADTFKVGRVLLSRASLKQAWKGGDDFWNAAKPSQIEANRVSGGEGPRWGIKWDDDFVDEIRRTFKACKLFMFLPIYYMADSGLTTIQTSQAGSMTTNGAPNDLLGNFNPLTIIIMAPVLNYGVYPFFRKVGINFSPIRRIVVGYLLGASAMLVGALLQWRVYETSPCGCVWAQVPLYALPATSELLVNITSYEIAYTRAPQRMKGLIFAIVLFMNSLSSALVLIISPSFSDPNLIWPFVGVGGGCTIAAAVIWWFFHEMDDEEGVINAVGTDRPIENMPVKNPEKA
ncbi:hypothetical protein H0H92_016016 [Tricholoma furcatifolium]|nr:hypothetical protein H0H92_016016 [Tricholoma furcatifolium]